MTKQTSLSICNLELPIYLGWSENERLEQQKIVLTVNIKFSTPPHACVTDNLNDTICYSNMIDKIRNYLAQKKFNLIEHVCYEIYQFIKFLLPESSLTISISKQPKIPDFSGKVSFCYSDEQSL
ncbi:MAG: hypothetical protein A3F11_01085 [Gammaproteobacteria bacterium RIFCSPHIGHO2_12_FULL_37_14]|nr:MAG: hypothetical protein A3F11_01085 [Gammaproteobacteria bacterium RIFCSPHIGHO2_12_FULL_37_14]